MGKSLDELRKKIYGSAAPDQKTVQEVRNKAMEVTTPVQKYGDIGSSYKSGTSGSAQSSFTTPAAGNLEALKSQQEQAKKERDEAHQAFLNLYALESNPDTAASAATRYEKYSTAEDARKAWKAADSAYQDALNAYYEAENKSKLTDLSADKKLTATYESAKELEADLKKVQEATITAGATGNADASDLAYLKKKYGVSGDSVFSLQESLQKKLDTLSQELKTGGYSYERLSGFQEREAKKTEYETQKAEWEEFAGDHPVASSALSVLASPFQGIDFVRMIGSSGGNGDSEDAENYVPPNVYDADIVNFVNTVRGTVSKEIEENTDWELFGQNVASFLYQTGMSITDSATQVAALGPASIYFMGASSAANRAANVIERGGTTQQAFVGGLAAGVAEGLFEKVSIDRLLDPSKFNTRTVKDALKSIGAQSLVEGSEETFTEISNILTDAAVMGSDSSFSLSVQAYENAGMSEEEAKKQAFLDSVGQVIWAGVGGALSGVSLGGARITFSKAQETANAYKTGAQLKTRMSNGVDTSVFSEIQKGMDAPEGSEARLLAESAQKQLDSKKRVSNATLGRLVWANQGNVVKDVQAVQSTGETTPETQELLTKVAQELQTSGTLTSATASELHTVAAQDVVGAVSVQEKEAAAKAANPEADVQSAAVTAFTDMGMKLKTAQEKAEIVTRLMDGEEVSNRDINKLNPTSPAMRQVFSQLTGVEFPAGKITQEALYNLYRSAKDVKTTEQVIAEVESADAELQGAREILDSQLPDGVTVDTILQSAVSGMSSSQPANDAEAARILGEQLGEIDVNGAPLVSFSAFSEMYRSRVNEKATREELARAYDQYRREVQTGQFQGKRQTRAEFAQTIRSAPGGAQLTDAEIDALFQQVQDANRSGEDGYDRYALNESERLQKKLLNRVPEAQREKTAAEMSRRGELDRAAKYMSAVLKDLGIAPGVVVEYGDENTRLADAFVASDGTIHFNGDKISGASMMQYILGHELTHTASRIAGGTSVADTVIEVFRKLYDAGVLSGQTEHWMADVDGRLDTLQRRYRQHAKAVGDNADVIDRAYVREELAADLMRQVFVSEDLMSRLAGERPSLLMRARRTADRILAKLTGNEDLRTVVSARDELKRLGDLFEKTLRKSEAEATYRSGQVIETEDGSPVAVSEENGDMKFSLGSFDEHGRNVLRSWMTRAVRRGDLTQEDADSIMESMETIYRVCREHQTEYAPFDNWSEAKVVTDDKGRPVFSVVKANGDYAMNLDFSTVCKKRRTLDAVLNELVRNGWASENRIAEDQMVKINDIIRAHGFETACALCFVDSKRFRQDKIAGDFTEMYNRAVKSLVPDGSDIPVNTFDFAGRGLTDQENGLDMRPASDLDFSGLRDTMAEFGNQTVSYKIAKYLMDHPADRRLLDKSDFLSSAGFNVISREKPGILSLFNSKKGSGGPKSTFGDVQYLNEIIRSRTFNAKKAFSVGGVRIQSFSDYVPRMVFDYVQMIGDLSAKKLPAHSYTKEELFVKQFGLTGIKINMSLIPRVVEDGIAPGLDSRGDYIWADESFDFNTAVEIQGAEGYSRNCGTIAVGISDEHIRAMMSDDRIRMIIPYHKSGLNPVVAELNNIDSFVDYTGSQNTRYSDGRKIEDKKILKTIPDFNQEMRHLGDPRAAAESYVRFCESKGYLPKFDQFAYQQVGGVFVEENGQRVIDPNYYKLLEDFTVYDNGEYVGQEAVRPVYPAEDSAFGSMADLILRGLDEDAVLEGRRDAEVASIVREVEDTLGDVRAPGLRGGDGRDTMNTSRYSLGEDLAYGAEQRESAEEFRRRSLREGYAVLSFGGAEFAFRRGRGSVLSGMELGDAEKAGRDTPAGETERELTALGIPCDVISGPVFWNNGSVTRERVIQEATTAAGRHVFIDENTSLPPREIAGHEAFHFWSKSGDAEDYKDTVLENLNFTSPAFQKFQSDIAEAYLGTQADLADERQYAKLLEELLAYISGKIHAGGQDDALRPMLRDYDSVVRAWEDLVGGRTSGQARYALPDRDLSFAEQVDLTLLNKFNEVMAPGRSGQYGSAESALYVAREPNSLLQDIGFGDLPIVITQQHVRQITGRREDADGRVANEHNHQLTQGQVSRIPELLQNPAAILRAKGRPGSAVIVTEETDYKGRPVIIPIKSNGMDLVYDGMIGPAHVITSMYGRDNFGKFFADAVNSGDLLYADKKRIDPILTTAGYQSSGLLSGIDSQTILGQITPNVNTRERRYALSDAELDDILSLTGDAFDEALLRWLDRNTSYDDIGELLDISFDELSTRSGQPSDTESTERGSEPVRNIVLRAGLSDGYTADGNSAVMTQSRIDREIKDSGASSIGYARKYITRIRPTDFLDMTVSSRNVGREVFDNNPNLSSYHQRMSDYDYVDALKSELQTPYLSINMASGQIIGHEGRHRVRALEMAGIQSVEIVVEFHDENGYLVKTPNGEQNRINTIPEMEVSAQFDTDVGTVLRDIIPLNEDHRAEIEATYGETATPDAGIRYSITPEFEQWYKENYGVDGDITDAQLRRAMKRQDRKVQRAEERAQAARSKAKVDAENTLTAWLIYYKKNMRRLNRDLQKKSADRVAELRKEKAQALQDKDLAWRIYHEAAIREQRDAARRAEKDLRKEMTQEKRDAVRTATEVERAKAAVQHDADVMAFKRQAAARLRVKDTRYAEQKERTKDQVRLKRKAAERALKDSRQAAKKRAELEAKNGVVKTIREIPAQRKRIEKLQEQAANLKTLFRPAYAAFVNQAKSIDDFAKRQSGGVLSSTLVNVLGGSSTTIESVFKRGLVDRSGNRIGDAMKNVFLVWDGKKVDEAKQALLQDYMLHAHNVDRMSFVKNARAKLEAFETENPWLRDMDQREFARLVAMTETEIQETGKKKAHDLAVEYAKLLDRYNRSQDKPIFADANGNAVTAETSQAIVEQYLAENPWLEEKAQGIYDWWDQFMRTWAVGDSLTLEQYEIMREIYPHYVPTYRADKKGVGAANFVGAGGATIGTAVKKAKGGFSEVVNIEDSFANLANKIIRLARTNELYKNIIDTALLEDGADSNVADMAVFDWDSVTMGDSYKTESGEIVSAFSNGFDMSDRVDEAERPGLLKVKDGYKLSAWYDGQLLSAYISEDLYKSIARVTGSDANDFSRAFLKVGNALTGTMKTAITGINPAFAVRNISRDLPTAVVNSISGAAFLKYYGRALSEMKRNSDNWQVFQALGGTHAGYYNNNKGFAGAMAQRDNVLAKAGTALGRFNDITEAQTRFAEYLATIDRLGDTYENRLLGIKNAAEVTVDFSRKGWLGKYINAWVPYWNPAVQGIDKVVRSMVDSPDGSKVWKQASRTLGRAALGTVMLEAILQVVLAALGRRDEWEQLDDRTKDTYYCIPMADSYTFLKIPKNREWGAILGTPFMRMLEWANGRDNPFENYLETSIIPNFLPPLPSDTIGFSQWNDLSTNEDFAGRAIVPYAYEQGSLTEQYDADTSVVAKFIAQHLNFSPMQLDYLINDYFGDFGEMFQKATAPSTWSGDSGVSEFGKSAADIFFGGFEADARYSNAAVSKYYDTMDELSRVVQDKKNHMGSEDYKETIEYQTQSAINKLYGNAITDLNTEIRNLPAGEEKDAAKAEIARLASEALDFYEQSLAGNVESPKLQAEYNEYAPSVRNALIDLDDYSTEYRFKPTGDASDSYTDPTDDTREYVLSEDQKDKFHEIYVEQYNDMACDLINQSTYRGSKPEEKAEMLEGLRDDVLDATKEEFFLWLERTKARSTPKS